MPIRLIRADLTALACDAIVNPTNPELIPGGGLDERIHALAGEGLAMACEKIGHLAIGSAAITRGYDLKARYVIHTAGPVWKGGESGEEAALRMCYLACLDLAARKRLSHIAVPLIASGENGFPKDRVLRIAHDSIGEFLLRHEMTVDLVVWDKTSFALSQSRFDSVQSYLTEQMTVALEEESMLSRGANRRAGGGARTPLAARRLPEDVCLEEMPAHDEMASAPAEVPSASLAPAQSLEEMLGNMDKPFADTLFSYIDLKGITDVECYKRANVDKKTFSKIKCQKSYRPSKETVISFALALHLNLDQASHLLRTAGYSLSRSRRFDVIIEYFIVSGKYDTIFDVNETLYQFDEATLGV